MQKELENYCKSNTKVLRNVEKLESSIQKTLMNAIVSCSFISCHPISLQATRRPREFFRRSLGTSGATADPSDIKPQVL